MSKNIIILADGTWSERGKNRDTNVAKLCSLIEQDSDEQIAFYDPGIGIDSRKWLGGVFGVGISENIRQCYAKLIELYEPDDRVFLYGFSRGAYTVRSLAGFIYKCGLLHKAYADKVMKAYNLYRKKDSDAAAHFKAQYGRSCQIHFIGVWDTVGALGIPVSVLNWFNPFAHRFHDTRLNPEVRYAYHAVAIDDQRNAFHPTLWDEDQLATNQTLEQVWFAGSHSDVGGSYPDAGLSDIPLAWMIEQSTRCGLRLNADQQSDVKPNPHGLLHNSRAGWAALLYRRAERNITAGQIHPSVIERLNRSENQYAPQNLLRHTKIGSLQTSGGAS